MMLLHKVLAETQEGEGRNAVELLLAVAECVSDDLVEGPIVVARQGVLAANIDIMGPRRKQHLVDEPLWSAHRPQGLLGILHLEAGEVQDCIVLREDLDEGQPALLRGSPTDTTSAPPQSYRQSLVVGPCNEHCGSTTVKARSGRETRERHSTGQRETYPKTAEAAEKRSSQCCLRTSEYHVRKKRPYSVL
eukprot:scaffold1419_cov410-Prasinococcus_capsulatus_cf.AAC.29